MTRTPILTTKSSIIKVSFHRPINNQADYYFGSLKAIFALFSREDIGCKVESLYSSHITTDNPKITDRCIISKHTLYHAKQNTTK